MTTSLDANKLRKLLSDLEDNAFLRGIVYREMASDNPERAKAEREMYDQRITKEVELEANLMAYVMQEDNDHATQA